VRLPDALAPLVADPARSALVTDFDGSISAIVDDPFDARPLPGAGEALAALAPRLARVGVLSGRPVEFLREALDAPGVVLVGQYGLERLEDGEVVVEPGALAHADAMAAAFSEAAATWPDVMLERKGDLAFTIHWRTDPATAPDPAAMEDLARRHGLWTQPGRMACELRPPIALDKGAALERLAAGIEGTLAYAGDDAGDLSAFAVVEGWSTEATAPAGVKVAVASSEGPPDLRARADLVVEGPGAWVEVLRALAEALSRPR